MWELIEVHTTVKVFEPLYAYYSTILYCCEVYKTILTYQKYMHGAHMSSTFVCFQVLL